MYFEQSFTDLYISPHGAVSFGEGLPSEFPFPMSTFKQYNLSIYL